MTDYTNPSQHFITGQALPCFTYQTSTPAPSATETRSTKKELIEQWYLDPLQDMGGHEAFICLAICFLLYEKYLRVVYGLDKDYKFSEGAEVFRLIGKDLGTSEQMAYRIWADWRNGLLHRGMPQASDDQVWMLTDNQNEIIIEKGREIWVNPWLLRDRIVGKLRQNKDIWRDGQSPLMREFEIIQP